MIKGRILTDRIKRKREAEIFFNKLTLTPEITNKTKNKIMELTIDKYKVSLNISSRTLNEISKLSLGRNELRTYGMLMSMSHINN
tara:strand:- start:74 stop:328 length:255 start_codon:yes stop_codon:yes gene_type:complete